MRRLLGLTLVLGAFLLALQGCGQSSTPPAPAGTTETVEKPTLEAEKPTGAKEDKATKEPTSSEKKLRLGLVTSEGRVNDGTFNQLAHEGASKAIKELGWEYKYIETQAKTDYAKNIQTFVDEKYDIIITIGFPIADATFAAAKENPKVTFIGVDQSFSGKNQKDESLELPNLVGIQAREDQAGFLAGSLAGMLTKSGTVGVVGGIDIPPVKRFKNSFENGAKYAKPEVKVLSVYIPSFIDPAQGASAAKQFLGEGADVLLGAGGTTGSGAIKAAAEQGAFVMGVDQDEYVTTFANGKTPGADKIVTSAVKRVDVGVVNELRAIAKGTFKGNGNYVLDASNGGIGYAEFHQTDAVVPENVKERLKGIEKLLASGKLTTGVNFASGDVDKATMPEPMKIEP